MQNRRLGLALALSLLLTLVLSVADEVAQSAPEYSAQAAITGPTLTVDVQGQRYPISPDIYGLNGYGTGQADFLSQMQTLRLPVERWGGNAASRYNWQTNSFNSGLDWYFEGNPNTGNNPAQGQPSESDAMINRDRANNTKSIITVPMIGYVSKSRTEYLCGFSVAKYGQQTAIDFPYAPDCGNGTLMNGTKITGNDPLDTSIAVGPDFVKAWINNLTSRYGTAANGGVKIYQLDNEPSGWYETHRDVHPAQLTYNELRDRTYQYGAAVKEADSSAFTLGPSNFGFAVYADSLVEGDKANHNNIGFSEWYLQQMKLYEQQHGVRILDYFDQHYYPAQDGVTLAPAGNAATQQQRLRSTRSLWDPTYQDESWIQNAGFGPIHILPVFHNWIDTNYPGTKLAITEYNWGGLESINGALAQADVLGIFGRERVDLATLWDPPTSIQPGAFAFRIYRNYDGQGSAYGDTWAQAASSDQGSLAIYAAQRDTDHALTLVIINKTDNDLTSSLALSHFQAASQAQVYRYSSANLNAIVRQSDQAVGVGGFQATYPANSITLLVLPPTPGTTLTVTAPTDDGSGTADFSLSKAIEQAQPNDTILLNVPKITLSGPIQATLKTGVTISGGACNTSTAVTIDFNGQPGLVLPGNITLQNVILTGMSGTGLKNSGNGNFLSCTSVHLSG